MWWSKPETRASDSLTDLVVAGLVANATGTTTAPVATLAAVEACAGLWGRSFASASVTPATAATATLTPDILERIGRALLLKGEAIFAIDFEDGELRLQQAVTWDISGHADWIYRADFSTPSGTISRTLPSAQVVHVRINTTPARPWEGSSPLPRATANLAASIESKLIEEVGGPVGSVLPMPHAGDSLKALQADVQKLKGRLVMVESTAGGFGDAAAAPKSDWMPRRIGAAPPASMIELRERAQAGILAATGCPLSLLERSDGTLSREELRRFAHTTIEPVALVVAGELADKLGTPGLALNFEALFASDLSGRARAFGSLVKGGMSVQEAVALAGLAMGDDD